jgi:small subunit ribosomal protein S16
VVVTEHARAAKSSNYVEVLGNYSPHTDTFAVKQERVQHWLKNGAKASPTVHNLFVTHNIVSGKKINVLPKKTPIIKEVAKEEAEAPVAVA